MPNLLPPPLWLVAVFLAVCTVVLYVVVSVAARFPGWWIRRRRAQIDRPGFPVKLKE